MCNRQPGWHLTEWLVYFAAGPLWGESTSDWWFPSQRTSTMEYSCHILKIMKSHSNCRLGAGNYLQPQLPTANMTDPDLGTERYSLFMHILSTHSGAWVLYKTEQHVCIYWTPPFDSHVLTFAARRRGRKRQAHGNLQLVIIIKLYCKLPSTQMFSSSPSTCISRDMWIKWWCSVNSNMLFCHIQNPKPRNVCLKFAWTANTEIGVHHVGCW